MQNGDVGGDEMTMGSEAQRAVLGRFAAAAEADDRVVAAFLGGSFAAGTADAESDLDIYLVVADDAYDDFFGERRDFVERLGRPVFLDDFNDFGFDMLVFTLDDGVEGELSMARESHFAHIHGGPYKALADKKGLLAGKVFPLYELTQEQQRQALRKLVYWFWDNVSHFISAMHRGERWSAYGCLDEMRLKCLKLARLRHDFKSEHTGYSRVERIVPAEELHPLEATCCPLEPTAMLEAARTLIDFYRQTARPLASEHTIDYPTELDKVVSGRFLELRNAVASIR